MVSCSATWVISISTSLIETPKSTLRLGSRTAHRILLTALMLSAVLIVAGPRRAESLTAVAQKDKSSQGLWVVEFGSRFVEFQGTSLQHGGTPNPTLGFNVGPCCPTATDFAFDKAGDLWLGYISSETGFVFGELAADELKQGKKAKSLQIIISFDPGVGPAPFAGSLAFDSAGDLWIADQAKGDLVEYTPDQLAVSGRPAPAATLHFTDNPSTGPAVIRFDPAGDLWLAYPYLYSSTAPSSVEFTSAQVAEIQQGGAPAPALTVEAAGPDLVAITAIAFDAESNLWIAAITLGTDPNGVESGSVEMFHVAGKSGTLSLPDVTITPSAISSINQSLDSPSGLAFDKKGGLWVANSSSSDQVSGGANSTGFLVKFAASQLAASGSPVPPTVISPNRKGSNLKYPAGLIFGPTVK
jgi:hypothetical protein